MPSYRALREEYSLKTLFLEPELASLVTLMPVEELNVDAAILFSDISVVALALGLRLDFSEGPKVEPFVTPDKVPFLSADLSKLDPVIEAVRLSVSKLSVPLIGFCGGPFTVASYLVEGGVDFAKRWAYRDPDSFQNLLDRIAEISVAYLKAQIGAGASAVQIFDSWANALPKDLFSRFCLPYYHKILDPIDAPSILFMRGAWAHLDELLKLPCALSLDWQSNLSLARRKTKQPLQGNLDPDLLFAPKETIRRAARDLLASMDGDPAFIAGLGHGMKPDAPFDAAKTLIEALQGR